MRLGPGPGQFRSREDRIDNLRGRERAGGDGDVGGAIEGQAALVACGESGAIGEQGAGAFGAAATGQGGGQIHFQMNQQGCRRGKQQSAVLFTLNGAAAQGENEVLGGDEPRQDGVFAVAKGGFAVTGEECGNGAAGFSLDHVVQIEKAPAQAGRQQWARGAFAGPHEAGQHQAAGGKDGMGRGAHLASIGKRRPGRAG